MKRYDFHCWPTCFQAEWKLSYKQLSAMSYEATLLNISTLVYLAGLTIITIRYYGNLSTGEGWGLVAIMGFFGIGLFAGLIDFILQLTISNKVWLNIIGALVMIIFLRIIKPEWDKMK